MCILSDTSCLLHGQPFTWRVRRSSQSAGAKAGGEERKISWTGDGCFGGVDAE